MKNLSQLVTAHAVMHSEQKVWEEKKTWRKGSEVYWEIK